jgi:hypothetical protein
MPLDRLSSRSHEGNRETQQRESGLHVSTSHQ